MIDRLGAGDAGAGRALQELAGKPDGHRPFEHPFYWGAFISARATPLRSDPGLGAIIRSAVIVRGEGRPLARQGVAIVPQ
jgi:hypothetical protein